MTYAYTGVYTSQERVLNFPPSQATSNITGVLATSEGILDDAVRWADSEVAQAASHAKSRTITNETHQGDGKNYFYVNEKPILSLVSLEIKTGDLTYATAVTTDCILSLESGKVTLAGTGTYTTFPADYPESIRVSYTAGVDTSSDEFYLLQALATHIAKLYVLENASHQIAETGVNPSLEIAKIKDKLDYLWKRIGFRSFESVII